MQGQKELKCQFITFSHAGISISNITSMPNISNFVLIFIIIFADQIPSVGLNCLTFTIYNSQVLPDLHYKMQSSVWLQGSPN